jgi:hypothetical protein
MRIAFIVSALWIAFTIYRFTILSIETNREIETQHRYEECLRTRPISQCGIMLDGPTPIPIALEAGMILGPPLLLLAIASVLSQALRSLDD